MERPIKPEDREAILGCTFMILSTLLCCAGFVIGYAIRMMMR